MKTPVKEWLRRYELEAKIGREQFFSTTGAAVKAYLAAHDVPWVDWEDAAEAAAEREAAERDAAAIDDADSGPGCPGPTETGSVRYRPGTTAVVTPGAIRCRPAEQPRPEAHRSPPEGEHHRDLDERPDDRGQGTVGEKAVIAIAMAISKSRPVELKATATASS